MITELQIYCTVKWNTRDLAVCVEFQRFQNVGKSSIKILISYMNVGKSKW